MSNLSTTTTTLLLLMFMAGPSVDAAQQQMPVHRATGDGRSNNHHDNRIQGTTSSQLPPPPPPPPLPLGQQGPPLIPESGAGAMWTTPRADAVDNKNNHHDADNSFPEKSTVPNSTETSSPHATVVPIQSLAFNDEKAATTTPPGDVPRGEDVVKQNSSSAPPFEAPPPTRSSLPVRNETKPNGGNADSSILPPPPPPRGQRSSPENLTETTGDRPPRTIEKQPESSGTKTPLQSSNALPPRRWESFAHPTTTTTASTRMFQHIDQQQPQQQQQQQPKQAQHTHVPRDFSEKPKPDRAAHSRPFAQSPPVRQNPHDQYASAAPPLQPGPPPQQQNQVYPQRQQQSQQQQQQATFPRNTEPHRQQNVQQQRQESRYPPTSRKPSWDGQYQQQQAPPYYQQQQQYQQPRYHQQPPQQTRPQPQQKAPPKSKSKWQRALWKRVEGGLDVLSDLEQSVTSKLNQAATSSKQLWSQQTTRTNTYRPQQQQQQQQQQQPPSSNQQPPQQQQPKRPNPFQKGSADAPPNTRVVKPGVPLAPDRYAVASRKNAEQAKAQASDVHSPTTPPTDPQSSRRINWDNVGGTSTTTTPDASTGGQGDKEKSPPMRATGGGASNSGTSNNPWGENRDTVGGIDGSDTGRMSGRPPSRQQPPQPFTQQRSSFDKTSGQRPKPSQQPPARPFRVDRFDATESKPWWKPNLGALVPPLPKMLWRRQSTMPYSSTMDAWDADDKEENEQETKRGFWPWQRGPRQGAISFTGTSNTGRSSRARPGSQKVQPMLTALANRWSEGRGELLTRDERQRAARFGSRQGFLEVGALVLILILIRDFQQMFLPIAGSQGEIASTWGNLMESINHSPLVTGWAPLALLGLVLVKFNKAFLESRVRALGKAVGDQVSSEAEYGSLFLRLYTAMPMDKRVPGRCQSACQAQLGARAKQARLQTFSLCLLLSLVVVTMSFVKPILLAAAHLVVGTFTLEDWGTWPIDPKSVALNIKKLFLSFAESVSLALGLEMDFLKAHPYWLLYDVAIAGAFALVSFLPQWESSRSIKGLALEDDDDDLPSAEGSELMASRFSSLGASSANRLQLLSDNTSIDEMLERWRGSHFSLDASAHEKSSLSTIVRIVAYGVLGVCILLIPVFAQSFAAITPFAEVTTPLIRWDSFQDLSVVLAVLYILFVETMGSAVASSTKKQSVSSFVSTLAALVKERKERVEAPSASVESQASLSSVAGFAIRDLWAAHTTKRAWAVRGMNIQCPAGQVVLLLSDDESHSKLLTSVAEVLVGPPKGALTTTKVRGSMSVAGMDVSKWDNRQLRKRVGLLLQDARALSDMAQALSGLSIQEIIEPASNRVESLDPSHKSGPNERSCMLLALKMTGLGTSLLPRLTAKLSTIVTANEDDLMSSHLPYTLLSQEEWANLILTRVLAQTIYDNESAVGTNDRIEKSLMGSVLLLDNISACFSDESRFLGELKTSSAATLVTSSRWTLGRSVDRIVVIRNGAIVETGSHGELLSRGPKYSLYAAKWHAAIASKEPATY